MQNVVVPKSNNKKNVKYVKNEVNTYLNTLILIKIKTV